MQQTFMSSIRSNPFWQSWSLNSNTDGYSGFHLAVIGILSSVLTLLYILFFASVLGGILVCIYFTRRSIQSDYTKKIELVRKALNQENFNCLERNTILRKDFEEGLKSRDVGFQDVSNRIESLNAKVFTSTEDLRNRVTELEEIHKTATRSRWY